MMPLPVS